MNDRNASARGSILKLRVVMYEVNVLQRFLSIKLTNCSLAYLGTIFDTIYTPFNRISNMEIYRTLNGPFPGCPSYTVLQKMYEIALPKLRDGDVDVDDIAHASLKVLNERDSKMFFPEGAVKHILDEGTIQEVLDCKGNCCRHARENSLSDFPVLVTWVFNRARILLAVLIYLGRKPWINTFRGRSIGDANLDRVISFINTERPPGLPPGFVKSYEEALDLFRPPTFVMGEPKFTYGDNQRFPYIEDEECGEGSFGKVRRFEIHPDYLDESLAQIAVKYSPPSALAEKSSHPPVGSLLAVWHYPFSHCSGSLCAENSQIHIR
jgi:hypothetical protein